MGENIGSFYIHGARGETFLVDKLPFWLISASDGSSEIYYDSAIMEKVVAGNNEAGYDSKIYKIEYINKI